MERRQAGNRAHAVSIAGSSSRIGSSAGDSRTFIDALVAEPREHREELFADPTLVRDERLHQLFEASVDRYPERIALECGDERLTYAEVDRRANQFARYLRANGVGPGALVAFLLPRSTAHIITLLAILKTGAAYVPLDPETPADRVAYIITDCHIHSLVTTTDYLDHLGPLDCQIIEWDTEQPAIARQPAQRLTPLEVYIGQRDLCYIIYTSGSTGRPKGVQLEHRSVCHLVRAEAQIFQVRPDDRVFHGFSIAFDASVEEVWLALYAGATLVVGTAEMVHAGPALAQQLAASRVSVLSCVPTLLSMLDDEIPALRLLIVGGESCPQDLVNRWSQPGRRMVNTYGPTEATVIATFGDLLPEKPVTIGIPVPNYQVFLLDADLKSVKEGQVGELYLGGIGLARGYVGRAELTAERFIPNPFGGGRLYRTGDLGRYQPNGEIEFMGRVDSQVKLRGYRIELSEIESALLACPDVQAAAVAVREDVPGIQQLVGYVIPSEGIAFDEERTKSLIHDRLPVYMIPTCLEVLHDFPTLPSGKVDRKRLPAPCPRVCRAQPDAMGCPRTAFEEKIARVWEQFFTCGPVSRDANFFHDLGGHSLLAARTVSELRKDPDFADLSVPDVYHHPVLHELAALIEARRAETQAAEDAPPETAPRRGALEYAACGLAQGGGLYLLLGLISLQWLLPFFTFEWTTAQGMSFAWAMLAVLGIMVVLEPVLLCVAVLVKWLLIGRYQPGAHPVWGAYYVRWWFVNQMLAFAPSHALIGTPLLNGYLRLLGARIGEDVFLGTDHIASFDLLTIGDRCSIGMESALLGYTVANGMLTIAPITVGDDCYVGARAMLGEHTSMAHGARLEDLSLLPDGQQIPAGETWVGSPARPLPRREQAARPDLLPVSRRTRTLVTLGHLLAVLALPLVTTAAVLPGLAVYLALDARFGWVGLLLAAPCFALLFILTFLGEIVLLKWALLGRVRAGSYMLQSSFYVRKRFVDQLLDACLTTLGPLYATLYVTPFFRLLGASLGRATELSTAHTVTPDLLAMAEGSFIADSVALGTPHIERGVITLAPTRIGRRTFIGNSAVLPAGTTVGDGGLIGVLSTRPLATPGAEEPGTAWLGTPAIFLPRRQINTVFPEETTYRPTRRLYAWRYIIEFFRITLPLTCFSLLGGLLFQVLEVARQRMSPTDIFLAFPLWYLLAGLVACGMVVLTKWALIGRYRPAEKPLWSLFVWKTELLTAMHEHLADPFIVRLLLGTPFASYFFRALGARIGSQVYLGTTSMTEFDLVTIEDGVALNQDSVVQSHLFEDRVMKMSTIHIGADATVGARAVVLYDSVLGRGTRLNDLSLVMKGETLPPRAQWIGSPGHAVMHAARPVLTPARAADARDSAAVHLPSSFTLDRATGI